MVHLRTPRIEHKSFTSPFFAIARQRKATQDAAFNNHLASVTLFSFLSLPLIVNEPASTFLLHLVGGRPFAR